MRILVKDLALDKEYHYSGTELEVEDELRQRYPSLTKFAKKGDLYSIIQALSHNGPYDVVVEEGQVVPLPKENKNSSAPIPDDYDPWPREADNAKGQELKMKPYSPSLGDDWDDDALDW